MYRPKNFREAIANERSVSSLCASELPPRASAQVSASTYFVSNSAALTRAFRSLARAFSKSGLSRCISAKPLHSMMHSTSLAGLPNFGWFVNNALHFSGRRFDDARPVSVSSTGKVNPGFGNTLFKVRCRISIPLRSACSALNCLTASLIMDIAPPRVSLTAASASSLPPRPPSHPRPPRPPAP